MVLAEYIGKKAVGGASKVARSIGHIAGKHRNELLYLVGVLALLAGAYYLFLGIRSYLSPPVTVDTYHLYLTFAYQGSLADFLSLKSIDTFTLTEANTYLVQVARYDAGSAPKLGISDASWSECADGLVITVYIDDRGYGPYCHEPLLEILTGQTSVDFTLNVSPGPHTLKVFVTYKGRPIASKVFTVSAPTYEEALKSVTK